jgi:hypothetical protein
MLIGAFWKPSHNFAIWPNYSFEYNLATILQFGLVSMHEVMMLQ